MDGGGGLLLTPFPSEAVAFWEREKRGGLSAQVNFFSFFPSGAPEKKRAQQAEGIWVGGCPRWSRNPVVVLGPFGGHFVTFLGSFCDLLGVIL